MDYVFQPMTQEQAEAIAFQWRYEGVYAFYNMDADEEDLIAFLDSKQRGDTTFSIFDHEVFIGFVTLEFRDAQTIEIGLGMHPDRTGNGQGKVFVDSILQWIETTYGPHTITLAVATFNERAIRVYQACDFKPTNTFLQETNGGTYPFLSMERCGEKRCNDRRLSK